MDTKLSHRVDLLARHESTLKCLALHLYNAAGLCAKLYAGADDRWGTDAAFGLAPLNRGVPQHVGASKVGTGSAPAEEWQLTGGIDLWASPR